MIGRSDREEWCLLVDGMFASIVRVCSRIVSYYSPSLTARSSLLVDDMFESTERVRVCQNH